jgi:hypothetical protein
MRMPRLSRTAPVRGVSDVVQAVPASSNTIDHRGISELRTLATSYLRDTPSDAARFRGFTLPRAA